MSAEALAEFVRGQLETALGLTEPPPFARVNGAAPTCPADELTAYRARSLFHRPHQHDAAPERRPA